MDYELLLFDRINIIKDTINKYGIENFYISFSGGKDSTILHYLVDMALPNNRIPRVFMNTGIEYNDVLLFVKELAKTDDRIIILNSNVKIKQMLEKNGYPFKSKEHSMRVYQFNKGSNANFVYKYINGKNKDGSALEGNKYVCPKILLYQFKEKGKYNYSNKCCYELKKKPLHKWEKENGRYIVMTGMRSEEGGNREHLNCVILQDNKLQRFHPLVVVDEKWENDFIKANNIKLCKLYYPPFNFKRTGCKGCPYALDLQQQLLKMEKYLPNEYKQCELIWKPVYEEYRRIGYRLHNKVQIKFDFEIPQD